MSKNKSLLGLSKTLKLEIYTKLELHDKIGVIDIPMWLLEKLKPSKEALEFEELVKKIDLEMDSLEKTKTHFHLHQTKNFLVILEKLVILELDSSLKSGYNFSPELTLKIAELSFDYERYMLNWGFLKNQA